MVAIDFGFNDGKVTIGSAIVDFYDGGWKSEVRSLSVQPSRSFPSGWAVKVDGVYGWDALEFIGNMNTTMSAGPFSVTVKRDTRVALEEMRASFVGAA